MTIPTQLDAWKALEAHYPKVATLQMRDLFRDDPKRFDKFSLRFQDILLDYSKNRITEETMRLLFDLAKQAKVKEWTEKMFTGEKINTTEDRAVLHVALRNRSNRPILVDGKDVMPEVNAVLAHMREFTEAIRTGAWKGYTGKAITDVVNIGIGGSDLGPVMVTEALKPYGKPGLNVHFVSNVDGTHMAETIKRLKPGDDAVHRRLQDLHHPGNHHQRPQRQGVVPQERQGASTSPSISWRCRPTTPKSRSSASTRKTCSSSGTGSAAVIRCGRPSACRSPCAIGMDNFEELLTGGHVMDEHFRTTPLEQNLPVVLGAARHLVQQLLRRPDPGDPALRPVHAPLSGLLPAGRHGVERQERHQRRPALHVVTPGPIIWGEPGTNGQHAFYQLIHQGTKLIPCDFLAPIETHNPLGEHHAILLSNFFAQTEALMKGKTADEVRAELKGAKLSPEALEKLVPAKDVRRQQADELHPVQEAHAAHAGHADRACTSTRSSRRASIWNINSFDQWGVELGKQLAKAILPELKGARESGAPRRIDQWSDQLLQGAAQGLIRRGSEKSLWYNLHRLLP